MAGLPGRDLITRKEAEGRAGADGHQAHLTPFPACLVMA